MCSNDLSRVEPYKLSSNEVGGINILMSAAVVVLGHAEVLQETDRFWILRDQSPFGLVVDSK